MYVAIMQEEGTVRGGRLISLEVAHLLLTRVWKYEMTAATGEGCYLSALLFRAMIIQAGRNQGALQTGL